MKKRKTQAEKQKEYIQNITKEFCKARNISELEFCEHIFNEAFRWVEENNFDEEITSSSTFWNWWKLIWAGFTETALKKGNFPKVKYHQIMPMLTI